MILDIKEAKGQLSVQDFKDVQEFFEPYLKSDSAYISFKEFYVSYTKDDDIIGTRDMTNSKDKEQRKEARKLFLKEYYRNVLKDRRRKQKEEMK
ncbi:hypothetical protein QJR52_06240 [Clostridium baratii]|uniref:hypothetical protein n=1 Tax=Clostridium baratii TaxID=1561 RepID=UPI0030CB8B5B